MKNLKLITLTSLLAFGIFANCHKREIGGNQVNGLILGQLIGGLGKGNCAISLNLASLYAGSLYSVAAGNSTIFTQANYEAASGSTVTAQGFSSYATVPFNRKYDAFVRPVDGSAFTTDNRNTALTSAKTTVNMLAYMGVPVAICAKNPTATTILATSLAAFRTGNLSTAEATAVNAALIANGIAGGTTTVEGGFGNCGAIAGAFAAFYGAVGTSNAASAYMTRLAYTKGGALLACSRIPRASCSLAGITTATRTAAIANQTATFEAIMGNSDCRKPEANFDVKMARALFLGMPKETQVRTGAITGGIYTNRVEDEGSTSSFTSNSILPEQAYPVSTALMSISSSFANAFPLVTGTTAYGEASFRDGSNINFSVVDSCEGIGFSPALNPSPASTTPKQLTEAKEIAYSVSTNGSAATAYYTWMATNSSSTATNDGIACNRSFRKKYAVPQVLGGGTLPDLNVAYGDGGTTGLVTACTYGGDATTRASVTGILGSTLGGLAECPLAAQGVSSLFGTDRKSVV